MAGEWSEAEVKLLIELWGEEGIQEQLEGTKRNKRVDRMQSVYLW